MSRTRRSPRAVDLLQFKIAITMQLRLQQEDLQIIRKKSKDPAEAHCSCFGDPRAAPLNRVLMASIILRSNCSVVLPARRQTRQRQRRAERRRALRPERHDRRPVHGTLRPGSAPTVQQFLALHRRSSRLFALRRSHSIRRLGRR